MTPTSPLRLTTHQRAAAPHTPMGQLRCLIQALLRLIQLQWVLYRVGCHRPATLSPTGIDRCPTRSCGLGACIVKNQVMPLLRQLWPSHLRLHLCTLWTTPATPVTGDIRCTRALRGQTYANGCCRRHRWTHLGSKSCRRLIPPVATLSLIQMLPASALTMAAILPGETGQARLQASSLGTLRLQHPRGSVRPCDRRMPGPWLSTALLR